RNLRNNKTRRCRIGPREGDTILSVKHAARHQNYKQEILILSIDLVPSRKNDLTCSNSKTRLSL
ncbi:MAG: hypothetical protein PHC61_16855, partial [Chitinivibrionales bacterium]|nr:hypothetical protein [Chitinivibrionales bacterium]